jgi:uncharacterized membrane protein YvlD (DUF360 family)
MAYYQALGYLVFWAALIASIILYVVKRKAYPIAYLISVSLYVFTVGYVIDVFDFSKNGVMLILAFSALLMIFMGWFITRTTK